MRYSPYDWYWDNGTDVFSSARRQRVAYSDKAYQDWLAAGGVPTKDPGPAELREVLAPYGLGLTAAETTKLQRYDRLRERPWLLAKALARLLRLLARKGLITAAEANAILDTDEQSDPDA
jgi:hypothetical protein